MPHHTPDQAPEALNVRDQVRELVRDSGIRAACAATGLGREQVLRLAAGAGVRRGTELVAAENLRRHRGDGGRAA